MSFIHESSTMVNRMGAIPFRNFAVMASRNPQYRVEWLQGSTVIDYKY